MRDRRRGQRGVALILVLWTFAAVAVLAAEFARAMHDEAASTRNFKESTRARMVAIAGINEAILAMQANRRQADSQTQSPDDEEESDPIRSMSHGDGQWVKATFRGHPYEVRVIDEAGKLALNFLKADKLREYFINLEIPDGDADTIADSIVDWIDEDDLHQPNGAESEYYEGLDRPYQAKNAYFDMVEELLLVKGVTHDIFYGHDDVPGLREIFSVYSKNQNVNSGSASPAVMQALLGIDRESADDFASKRRSKDRDAAKQDLAAQLKAKGVVATDKTPTQMTLEARVRDESGQVVLAHVGMVLNLAGNGDGLKVYRWYDSIFDDSDQSGAPAAADAGN